MIDTLKLARRLKDAGMPEQQADAVTEELNAGMRESAVTKADLNEAISKAKNELIIWQVGVGFALFAALKFMH